MMKGIVAISTPRGLHKLSYDISDGNVDGVTGYDVLLQLETPFLGQGRAQLKLNIGSPMYTSATNALKVNYRGQLSLNNQHFLSASFNMDTESERKGEHTFALISYIE